MTRLHHGLRRKVFGQHFLRDRMIITEIVRASVEGLSRTGARSLVEIGPGQGAITGPLWDSLRATLPDAKLRLIEKDHKLVPILREKFPGLELIESDFLQLEPGAWREGLGEEVHIVSNLPYSVGTSILLELIADTARSPQELVLMFQKEVSDKLLAQPGRRGFGSLSVWVLNRYSCEPVIAVPPSAFVPPPKVQSAVVRLMRRTSPIFKGSLTDPTRFQALLDFAFEQPRKMLRVNFAKSPGARAALEASGVDPTLRAEALSWEDWTLLWTQFQKLPHAPVSPAHARAKPPSKRSRS